MYRAIIRYFHGYDYRSLYKTDIGPWMIEKPDAESCLKEARKNNFYTDGFIEKGIGNE